LKKNKMYHARVQIQYVKKTTSHNVHKSRRPFFSQSPP
jgi:hypothetical protein